MNIEAEITDAGIEWRYEAQGKRSDWMHAHWLSHDNRLVQVLITFEDGTLEGKKKRVTLYLEDES